MLGVLAQHLAVSFRELEIEVAGLLDAVLYRAAKLRKGKAHI